ncbi:hypothetical protein VOLCADRAFT_90528 [Volvox carteri f. nagariensis]|uniref:Protein kinase domain-containing protein n=1 Tax=Volvox carteri f. nagariensis TaxID=3068 RepID=D8TUM5_VOLCA|nr:uncharacterized protein VOLCADRAFT_90528 [Volvox carteri f. nagariensis]EFJ48733.1 hypothetical protein VOLCADRAFT_90528 [Volvox carteri f. nagariensis]|eukprot:XP_002950065.1 hypothetical protein VOLCADRAFT_90528 [Volvox carteri f. nagariensis]
MISGAQDGSASLDMEFLTTAVDFAPGKGIAMFSLTLLVCKRGEGYGQMLTAKTHVMAAGTALMLENLRLLNVRFASEPLLSLPAFNTKQLVMKSVSIETDCLSLSTLLASNLAGSVHGPTYLFIGSYLSNTVSASSVNITCNLPAITTTTVDVDYVALVSNSLELYNALAAYATGIPANGSRSSLTIYADRNITMTPGLWKRAIPLYVTRNVTLRGSAGSVNLLDLQCVVNANWFFQFVSEYQYFRLWTLLTTTEVHLDEVGAQLRATTVRINFTSSTNETLRFSRLTGTGLDMININLTSVVRAVPYNHLVLDNPVIIQSFGLAANLTLLPVYDLSDLMTLFSAMQTTPISEGVVMCILSNITIDPGVWPSGGYNVAQPVLIVGQSNAGRMTWMDFQRVPNFVRVTGCVPSEYMYVQGMHLINFPNGLLQPPAGSALAGAQAAGLGVDDVSIYLTNFQGVSTCGPAGVPRLFLNQSILIITYTEFRLTYNVVMRTVGGTSLKGSGAVVGSLFFYDLFTVVADYITFVNITGWGWNGWLVNLTYSCPSDVPLLYNNAYEPLVAHMDEHGGGSRSSSLLGWQIALVVIGCVLFVALAASLIAWRTSVRRLRHEVEAVKSGGTDKKSSNGSADADTGSAGGRLGSSAAGVGGGGNQLDVGTQGSAPAAVVKGSQNGGAGGGGGTSDDSGAAMQYDKPPLEVLNSMMATLTQEMDDQHLTILEVIGQGGFGVVYRGMWKGLNVAVKTITFQDRVAGGEKAQHRAILEAAISSSLAHVSVDDEGGGGHKAAAQRRDNVLVRHKTVDLATRRMGDTGVQAAPKLDSLDCASGQTAAGSGGGGGGGGLKIIDKRTVLDWKLYLIQEYCDGGSLRTAILKRKFFDAKKGEPRLEMILDTCLELTGGLVHLHERNIIHGDLNPNNVLLKRDTGKKYGAICKIADFGLSIKMNADQSHISNMRRGTPFYTCPQILARGNMTKAADVYSMGVMMWEMYHCCMSYRSLPSGFAARENFPAFSRKAPHDFAHLLRTELEAQLQALKRGEMRTGEDVLGPDPAGDAAHMAACQD